MRLLVVLLILLSFGAHSTKKEISIAFGYENYDFDTIFNLFEQKTGIKVQTARFKNDRLKVELLQHATTDSLPDVVIVPADFLGLSEIKFSLLNDDWFLPTTAVKDISAASQNGIPYGVPIVAGNHLVLYYNKSLVAEPALTWRELIGQQTKLPIGVNLIRWSYNEMFWYLPFLAAKGELPLLPKGINLNTTGMQQAMTYYWQLARTGVVDPNCDYSCSVDLFISGKLAYTINGVWALNNFETNLGENLGIALLPSLDGQRLKPYYSVHALAFPNRSAHSEKASWLKELALFFQSKQAQDIIWKQMHSLPTNKHSFNAIVSSDDANLKSLTQQLEFAEPMPNTRNMAIVWEAMLKGMQRYQAGLLTAEEASRYMQYIATRSVEELEGN